jgi:hypothetical protein
LSVLQAAACGMTKARRNLGGAEKTLMVAAFGL